ncbi:ATP synthase subunit B family protein [Helcococcus sueciensis]|uniref:hypothetical protein n=1 Tax=Helcococcus sueciensis TaxID=241555 RepID=UPI0004050279|nr:hypothetical protein [Helcococcus sueciensis]
MDIISLLDELEELIDEAGSVPFSKKVTVHPDDIYGIINDMKDSIPQEIKDAQWVNEERDRIISEANTQAANIKERAQEEVQRSYEEANRRLKELVNENSITVAANEEADRIISEAKSTASTITTNSLAYVDQILSKTEDEVKKTLQVIEENRSQLKY